MAEQATTTKPEDKADTPTKPEEQATTTPEPAKMPPAKETVSVPSIETIKNPQAPKVRCKKWLVEPTNAPDVVNLPAAVLAGCPDESEAKRVYLHCHQITDAGGFQLTVTER